MGFFGDVSRIYRGFRRRIYRGVPLDSYPFLSGDSYFFSCQEYFESGMVRIVPSKSNRRQKKDSLFVRLCDLEKFILFLSENLDRDYSGYTLVLHNGDDVIPKKFLELLTARFRKIFAVNLLESSKSYCPIPIGLENRNYFTNGIPADFEKLRLSGLKSPEMRTTLLLQAYSTDTNRAERESCSEIASKLDCKQLQRATPSEYRRALSESKFVLSPAGNGFDCHRTWEAMYLGAIPILRRAHWPFINKNLPVLLLDEWDELLELDLRVISVPHNPTWSKDFWNSFYND